MRVKVCGIRTYEDAALCLDEGVDGLGFNFYSRSPRFISAAEARSILKRLPPLVTAIGLFVNSPISEVVEIALAAGIQVLQLHGDETPEYCSHLGDWPLIKAIRVDTTTRHCDYPVAGLLLDSKDPVLFGGTGKSFDWSAAAAIASDKPIILAGGLHSGNVREAILTVRPYAVDVCSGVESEPGKKDGRRLKAFMNEVRDVTDEIRRRIPFDAR